MFDREIKLECPAEMQRRQVGVNYERLQHEDYYSQYCRSTRGFCYMLPPNYEEGKKYPVLYIMHGMFGDEYSMTEDDKKIKEIVTNMILDGYSEPFVAVFPSLYAKKNDEMAPDFHFPETLEPYNDFIHDLMLDLIPYTESHLPILPGRENRWFFGFSMGGRQLMYFLIQRPDLARHAGIISPAPGLIPGKDWAMEHPGMVQESELNFPKGDDGLGVLMICHGLKDGVVGRFPVAYHDAMVKNGCEHFWIEPDFNHGNEAVMCGLYNFLNQIAVFEGK